MVLAQTCISFSKINLADRPGPVIPISGDLPGRSCIIPPAGCRLLCLIITNYTYIPLRSSRSSRSGFIVAVTGQRRKLTSNQTFSNFMFSHLSVF
jgi:hypothetical protein